MSIVDPATSLQAEGTLSGRSPESAVEGRCRIGSRFRSSTMIEGSRLWVWSGLAIVLVVALGLRLWGIKQGLPFVYNVDEETLFLKRAVVMVGHSANPHYFENPPAFTYMLYLMLVAWLGKGTQVLHEYELHPATVYIAARTFVAVLGTLAVWLLYLTGVRLFSRAVGLLAAAVMAVAFLPVFYSHLVLNDVPMLAPLSLALFGTAGVLKRGRPIDYLLAGFGMGLASATKYTGGIILVSLLAASIIHYLTPRGRRVALFGLGLAGIAALLTFVATDPYAVLAFGEFHAGIAHQATDSSEAEGKLGISKGSGLLYYLWTFTWGLGWVPSLAALGGALTIWRHDRKAGWVLVPTVIIFLAFMGFQTRYFGRWLLPIFPIVCLLGAYVALQLANWVAHRLAARGMPWPKPILITLVVLTMCAQGLVYSTHAGLVLSRPFTFELARRWMVAHVPVNSRIVVEPVVPNTWLEYAPDSSARTEGSRYRWIKLPTLRKLVEPNGRVLPPGQPQVKLEDYERTLSPALIPYYERRGYCWVLTGTTQSGRAYSDPSAVPQAIAYYRALAVQGTVVYHISPYDHGEGPTDFNFDWAFDYYPLAYALPGPEITIYHLNRGQCAPPMASRKR